MLNINHRGVARGVGDARGAQAPPPPLDRKCLEGRKGLKNYSPGQEFFLLAGTPISKFLATPLIDHQVEVEK